MKPAKQPYDFKRTDHLCELRVEYYDLVMKSKNAKTDAERMEWRAKADAKFAEVHEESVRVNGTQVARPVPERQDVIEVAVEVVKPKVTTESRRTALPVATAAEEK